MTYDPTLGTGRTMEELVAAHEGRLFGLAYRMLGSVAEAEDAVQEAFTRLAATPDVHDPAGWLTTVVANLCVDRLRSARARREVYVGPWLPEPLVGDDEDPAELAATADSLTLAFLTVLERLSPLERAVFLLHDVFGHPHEQVAGMLGRSHAAVRKLASRARANLGQDRPRLDHDGTPPRRLVEEFLRACEGADLDRLLQLLAPDVEFTSDGGGVVPAARRPVHGADRVARLLLGIVRRADEQGDWTLVPATVNGQPGLVASHRGEVDTVMALHAHQGRVQAIHTVRNPEKLTDARRRKGSRDPG